MAILLQRAGFHEEVNPANADFVIVNTCGFISPARNESLDTLQELASSIKSNQKLIAAGCWAQRQPEVLMEKVPDIHAVIGTRSWSDIVPLLKTLSLPQTKATRIVVSDQLAAMPEAVGAPGYSISGASAFLKIADGCNRTCAFCAIPSIKGNHVSRSVDAILKDAVELQSLGVQEINLIAQDTTYFGYDLGMKDGLAVLLENMVKEIPFVPWIRILYAFPGFVTPRLIEVIGKYEQILPYIDIPLQHAHPDVLRRMRRPDDTEEVRQTIRVLRQTMPEVAIRTTLIVGFPNETEDEFQSLLDFVREMKFDKVGVFAYSHEFGTPSGKMQDNVSDEVKQARREKLMIAQQEISLMRNTIFVGRHLQVLIEGTGDGWSVGRSYRDAPEIDGMVLIPEIIEPDQMIIVEVKEALEYDLVAAFVADG
jgi:ribosomal protein S12 methylthiotransferase